MAISCGCFPPTGAACLNLPWIWERSRRGTLKMKLEAKAKINWSLEVTGRREDGYHLLDMVMQSVTLSDTLIA